VTTTTEIDSGIRRIGSVATLGGDGPPRVTPSGGDTRRRKIVDKFTKNSGQTRSER